MLISRVSCIHEQKYGQPAVIFDILKSGPFCCFFGALAAWTVDKEKRKVAQDRRRNCVVYHLRGCHNIIS
jgi:hypothetical protein